MGQNGERQMRLGLTNFAALAYERGNGRVVADGQGIRLLLQKNEGQSYSDAQVDDYHADGRMLWRPPVQMRMRARFSHPHALMKGTAGFGFWNDPFGMTQSGKGFFGLPHLRLPQAVWFFFASPPSNMQLAMDVAGFGWKAATIDASSVVAKLLLPFAPLGILACRLPWCYRQLWPVAQRVLKIDEALLPVGSVAMDQWHDYFLEWQTDSVRFVVDGQELLRTRYSPRGPHGFVAWVDNQFMVATPQGRLQNGVIQTGEQWMEIASFEVWAGQKI